MKILALSVATMFFAAPAFSDEAVVIPNDNGRTVVQEHGLFHDKTTIIEHREPDAVVIPEERHDGTIAPDNGASSGEVGVDIGTHEHLPRPTRTGD